MQLASRRSIDHRRAYHLFSSIRRRRKHGPRRFAQWYFLVAAAVAVGTPGQARAALAASDEGRWGGWGCLTARGCCLADAGESARVGSISIEARPDTLFGNVEDLQLRLTRDGSRLNRLTVTVKLEQDQEWLDDLRREVTFRAGDTLAILTLPRDKFNPRVSTGGDLTASVDEVGGYDTGNAKVTAYVVSIEGPVVEFYLVQPTYEFREDRKPSSVQVASRMAPGAPRGVAFAVEFETMGKDPSRPDLTATAGEDYEPRSGGTVQASSKYQIENGRWAGLVELFLPLIDDDVREGDETFELRLRKAPGQSDKVQLRNRDGSPCGGECRHLIRITDEEDIPLIELSVRPDKIMEDGETSSTATLAITGNKSFAGDQVFTLDLGGTATKGDDYMVSPADADNEAAGYQVVVPVEATSTEVTLRALTDEVNDPDEKIEISAMLDGNRVDDMKAVTITNRQVQMPRITLAASRDTIIAGLEALVLTATREAPLDAPLAVTLQVTQEQNWLSRTSFQLNFAAGGSTANLNLSRVLFSSDISESGTLTAAADSVSGYDTEDATAAVFVVSQPSEAVRVSIRADSYTFEEDEEDPVVEILARAAPGMPRGATVTFSVVSGNGTATSGDDFVLVSETITVREEDFEQVAGEWVAGSSFSVSLRDDDVREDTESFDLQLEPTPAHSSELLLLNRGGGNCADPPCPYPVYITDDEDIPVLELSVSEVEIREEGGTSATSTVAITNGKTFADDQTLTFRLGGDAILGSDYNVSPADADDRTPGHQTALSAGSGSVGLTFAAIDDEREEGAEKLDLRAFHDGDAIGEASIRIVDRFPGPRVEITFDDVLPPRDEYTAGVAAGPFTARFTFSERVEGFTQEDIVWQTHSLTTVDTTNIGVLVWDYTVVREGLEYSARMMPDQNGRLQILVFPGAARSVATTDGNQLGGNSLWVDLPPGRLMVEPRTLTVDEGDEGGAQFLVLLTSAPTGTVTVNVTGTDNTALAVGRPTFDFNLPYWNGGWAVTVTAADDANASDDRLGLRVRASGGGYDGRGADLVISVRDDDASASGDAPEEDPLSLLKGLTPEAAAAGLFGEAELTQARLGALDGLGNRNGKYDLGDLLALVARRRVERSSQPRQRRSRTRTRGPGRGALSRRRPRRVRLALAMLAVVAPTTACDGTAGPFQPPSVQLGPDPGFMKVELRVPADARAVGAWLTVEGPDIGSLRAPGFEVFESDTAAGKEVVVAGALSEGPILEFRIPDRRLLDRYRVRLIEVTGEDYAPRDISQFAVSISR